MGSHAATRKSKRIRGFGTTSSNFPFFASGDLQKQQKKQQAIDFNFSFLFLHLFLVFFLPLGLLFFPSSSGGKPLRLG